MKLSITIADLPLAVLAPLAAFLSGSGASLAVAGMGGSGAAPNPPIIAGMAPAPDDEAGDKIVAPGTLDGSGLPHDTRIHSDKPTLTTKGVWRARRGVSAEDTSRVEAELRARLAMPPAHPAPMFDASQSAPPPIQPQPMAMPTAPIPMPTAMPMQPPAPMTQPQPGPAPASTMDFATFMQKIQYLLTLRDQQQQPWITAEYLAGITGKVNAHLGLQAASLTDFATRPDALTAAMQFIAADGRWV